MCIQTAQPLNPLERAPSLESSQLPNPSPGLIYLAVANNNTNKVKTQPPLRHHESIRGLGDSKTDKDEVFQSVSSSRERKRSPMAYDIVCQSVCI